jgi:colicin import membrane protein
VTLRWRLDKGGRLVEPPEIMDPQSDPEIMPSAQSAMRAVRACQPFRLPAERYDVWKVITWEFDPTAISN